MLTFALMLVGVGVWAIYDTPPTNRYPDPLQSFSHKLRIMKYDPARGRYVYEANPRGDRFVFCRKPTCDKDDQFIGEQTLLVYADMKSVALGVAIGQIKRPSHFHE